MQDVRERRKIGIARSTRSDASVTLGLGVLAALIGIPTSILVARALGPAGMGGVTLVATIGSYTTTMLTFGRTMLRVFTFPIPSVAAVSGHAIAGVIPVISPSTCHADPGGAPALKSR